MMKTCRDCKRELPLDEFYLQASARVKGKQWRMSYCKPCFGERGRKRLMARTPEQKAVALARRRECRKPLTPAQKQAAKYLHERWRNANREHVRERTRAANQTQRVMYPERYVIRDIIHDGLRGRTKKFPLQEWFATVEVFDHRCAYCGSSAKLTVDHVLPVSRGGDNAIENLIPACLTCNLKKGARGILSMVNVAYQGAY